MNFRQDHIKKLRLDELLIKVQAKNKSKSLVFTDTLDKKNLSDIDSVYVVLVRGEDVEDAGEGDNLIKGRKYNSMTDKAIENGKKFDTVKAYSTTYLQNISDKYNLDYVLYSEKDSGFNLATLTPKASDKTAKDEGKNKDETEVKILPKSTKDETVVGEDYLNKTTNKPDKK